MLGRTKKMLKIIIVLMYILTSSLGMILIKKGGTGVKASITDGRLDVSITGVFVIGLALYVISFLLWIYVLQLFTLTYISPVVYGGV